MGEKGGFIQQFIEWIIQNGGLYFLLFVVFAETGLFVGVFLPGDSLLFAAGIFMNRLVNELAGFDIRCNTSFWILPYHYSGNGYSCFYNRQYCRVLVW